MAQEEDVREQFAPNREYFFKPLVFNLLTLVFGLGTILIENEIEIHFQNHRSCLTHL
jgi:hypothetical protein